MVPEEIEAVFYDAINPMLQKHGGYATPLVYESGRLLIRMGGACRGCLSQDVTVNEIIKAELEKHALAHPVHEIQISNEVDPELWEMAQKILKGGTLP